MVSTLVDQDPTPGTADGERLDVLSALFEAYERKHHPIDLPDRVYEVLSRKRPLTLHMIRNLNKGLGISAQVLITDNRRTQRAPST